MLNVTPSALPRRTPVSRTFTELFRDLRRRGTIVGSFVSPELALHNGKYEMRSRQGPEIAREAYACLRRHCATTR